MTQNQGSTEQEMKKAQIIKPNDNNVMVELITTTNSTEQETDAQAPVSAGLTEPSNGLVPMKIYSSTELKVMGYKFAKLSINRQVQQTALKAKVKSIRAAQGIICPCLVMGARKCLKDGLSVLRSDGTEVNLSDSDVDRILVIIDGQHRDDAIKKLNQELKKGESAYECYYYLPLNPNPHIVDLLREVNVSTKPWKGGDFLTNVILTAPQDVDTEMLLWVQARYASCGDVASWLWATLDPSRVYLKSTLVKASKSEDLLKKVADKTDFEFGKKLYVTAEAKLSSDLVKLKIVPLTIIDFMKKQTVSSNKQDATDKICAFLNSLTDNQVNTLKSFKRQGTLSKDQQIESELITYWTAFCQVK